MSDDEKKVALALPGEWALQKILGPTLSEVGGDINKLYCAGRDRLVAAALRKVKDPDDGKQANLRVTRDVLWNGAFSDEEICAEYFGGVLASSRSEDGRSDDAIQYVDTIKAMSSKQLHLHYCIYKCLNERFADLNRARTGIAVNVGQQSELTKSEIWFATVELIALNLNPDTDFSILLRQGLIQRYKVNVYDLKNGTALPYASVTPSTYGVLLYAAAHNRLGEWRSFSSNSFGNMEGIMVPKNHASSLEHLLSQLGVREDVPAPEAQK